MEGPYDNHEYILRVSDLDVVAIEDRNVFGVIKNVQTQARRDDL